MIYFNNGDTMINRKQYHARYYQENKEQINKYNNEYYQKHKKERRQKLGKYAREHRKEMHEYSKKYRQTKKGKEIQRVHNIKRKKLRAIKLFDNIFKCETIKHHISDAFIFHIPKKIHQSAIGNNHREKLKSYVEKMYDISYLIIER